MDLAADNRLFLHAWGTSVALHGIAIGLGVLFTVEMTPILHEDVFTWDVTIVEGVKLDPTSEPVIVKKPVHSRSSVIPPVQHARKSEMTPTKESTDLTPEQPETALTSEEPMAQRSATGESHTGSAVAPIESEPTTVTARSDSIEAGSPQHESTTDPIASVPVKQEAAVPQELPAQDFSHEGGEDADLIQVAKVPEPNLDTQMDNRWLAELLWHRVAEVKRYPNSARMIGQEGKVIVKVVIRSDGELAEVSIKRSSGHELLDAAAIEAVKRACPLHMQHPLGRPHISVSLPLVYSLAN